MILIFIFLFTILILVAYSYNRLIKTQNLLKEGWSGVDVQLKKRHELVPNLVAVVKEYANYEEETLVNIVNARSGKSDISNINETANSENQLSNNLSNIIALAEKFPDLKADTNFLRLQQDLSEIEDHLQLARRYYNGTVRNFENIRQSFPSNMIANYFKFPEARFFELTNREIESVSPKVELT